MTIVFAFGISRPLSLIVVQTSTSIFPATKRCITDSSSSASICPWPNSTRARDKGPRFCRAFFRWIDRVVQKIDLSLAVELAIDRVANDPLVVTANDGLHREAV